MPNWCDNYLSLETTEENIQKILDADQKGEGGLFNLLHPMPPQIRDTAAGFYGDGTPKQIELELKQKANLDNYGYKNWYDWAVANWSTKWDPGFGKDISIITKSPTTVTLAFCTAWGPPIAFYDYLVDRGFKVYACYAETGNGFCGVFQTDENGEAADTCIDYFTTASGKASTHGDTSILEQVREHISIDSDETYEDEEEDTPTHVDPLFAQLQREGLGDIVQKVEESC